MMRNPLTCLGNIQSVGEMHGIRSATEPRRIDLDSDPDATRLNTRLRH